MKKLKLLITTIMAAAFLMSCGSGSNISKDSSKKLKNYDTYSYLPNQDTILNRDYNNDRVHEVIISTINNNMASEDFAIDNRQPDVLVYVHTMFDEKVDVNANPVYTNFSYYRPGLYIGPYYEDYTYENYFTIQRIGADGAIRQIPYKEKSIVIDFIDRRTNQILWRGTADEEIGSRRLERDLRNYVDEIFKKFP
ncbi:MULTISPECIES: DUF4136 domain-containing protein [Salegentibacter]|jgi:hypothetical protein|uniref:DUF4136 domain-containing protein n=1 Tax=Salegentibacter agarivorans TaxID=345907 RepID=A0A1I2PPI3_9FLAO|nr:MULTISPECIES: DUF4136 domain-containing protein [Salegentibacter]SFG18145.1 protein of unknown function [Salegentibacter agarivorans]